jgi:hypothetical protein
MNRTLLATALGLSLCAGSAAPAQAQVAKRLLPAAAGAVLGMGAGGYVALGIVTLKARHGQYLYVIGDAAFGWESAAVLAGSGTGIALGLWDIERLRNGVYGSIAGGLLGTGVGALVGHRIWPAPEGKWAGGVIGGAAGILVGVGVGALFFPRGNDDETAPGAASQIAFSIPVGL